MANTPHPHIIRTIKANIKAQGIALELVDTIWLAHRGEFVSQDELFGTIPNIEILPREVTRLAIICQIIVTELDGASGHEPAMGRKSANIVRSAMDRVPYIVFPNEIIAPSAGYASTYVTNHLASLGFGGRFSVASHPDDVNYRVVFNKVNT